MKIAVIGAGPAGLFCTHELANAGHEMHLFDKGRAIKDRLCPDQNCVHCGHRFSCDILCGEGGAGGYSDGKLTLSPGRGIQMEDALDLKQQEHVLDYLEQLCLDLHPEAVYYEPVERPDMLDGTCFGFESYPLLFYGTWGIRILIQNLHHRLEELGVHFRYETDVRNVYVSMPGECKVLFRPAGNKAPSYEEFDWIVLATGSYDSQMMHMIAASNGLVLDKSGPAGFGIRLEAPDEILEPIMSEFYDFKLHMGWELDGTPIQYRSFCVNRGGKITNEYRPGGLVSINGRSERPATGLSNLAIMTKIPDGKEYVRMVASRLNGWGRGLPLCQPTLNFMVDDRIITYDKPRGNATKANLIALLPPDLGTGFQAYIREMSEFLPDLIIDPRSWVYAPEIKYHMPRWPVGPGFTVKGLDRIQVIGNAAGYTDSISTAAVMGIVAANHVSGRNA